MKKVLILAYDFPPYNSIGGQRPYSWYKYLSEFGIEPIVVTRHWDREIQNSIDYVKPSECQVETIQNTYLGTIIRVLFKPNLRDKMLLKYGFSKYTVLRKILTLIYQFGEFIFPMLDNRKIIYKAANNYLTQNSVDAIIATSEPFILFKYARKLSKIHNIPWCADYRDGWSTNYNRGLFEKQFYQIIEKSIIKSCRQIITVSDEFKYQLEKLHSKKLVEVVMNGYFPELFENLQVKNSEKFTLGFAGTLYNYQPIELFAKSFNFSPSITDYISIKFIGLNFYPEQKNRIENAFIDYKGSIETTDRLSHIDTLNELNACQLLLLPASSEQAQLYAKTFDYLALNKKILLFKNDNGALEKIILKTNSGIICNNSEEIADAIKVAFLEWQQKGKVKCNSININQYSRKEQAKKLATLLNHLLLF